MKMYHFQTVELMSLSLITLALANVGTPYPGEIYEEQPDGSNATVYLRGHPYHGIFQTDYLGHPVIRDDDGWLVYASHHDATISPISGRRHLRPSDRVVGMHDPPYNEIPNLRELSLPEKFDHDPIDMYRDLMSVGGFDDAVESGSVLMRLNDMLCEGLPHTQWCPNNPIDPTSMGRTSINANDVTGEMNLIVILVKFSDQRDRPVSPVSDYQRLFNDPTWGPTGGVSHFFETNSGGKFRVNAHVEDWIVSSQSEEYWSFGRYGLATQYAAVANEGLNAMDRRGTDWSKFDRDGDGMIDGVFIIHSGYAGEVGGSDGFTGKPWGTHRIWSHRSIVGSSDAWKSANGSVRVATYATTSAFLGSKNQQITRLGVVAHEMGHMLGLPDMLTGGSAGSGVGNYDIMGNMWGRDNSQLYPGLLSAWSRMQLGWASLVLISSPGVYRVSAAIDDPTRVYKITQGFPDGEYLLIENRVRKSFDEKNDDEGLMIWHIDDTMSSDFMQKPGYPGQSGWPWNGNHYEIALMQADRSYGLEKGADNGNNGDLYKAGMPDLGPGSIAGQATQYPNTDCYSNGNVRSTGVRLSGFSTPGDVMSFTYSIDGAQTSTTRPPTPHPTPLPTRPPTPPPIQVFSPTPYPTQRPTSPPTRPPTPYPTRHPTPRPTSYRVSTPTTPPIFETVVVAAGDPEWWPRVSSTFTGSPELKNCNLRTELPETGRSCGGNSKTCFFGVKQCAGVGASPAVRCTCENRSWECHEAGCDLS